MAAPRWAQDMTIKTMIYLESLGYKKELPTVNWKHGHNYKLNHLTHKGQRVPREKSSGMCYRDKINIVAGYSPVSYTHLTLPTNREV